MSAENHASSSIVPQPARGLTPAHLERIWRAREHSIAESTRAVYRWHFDHFSAWCKQLGLSSLPAEPTTVEAYLCERAAGDAKATVPIEPVTMATVHSAAAAIRKTHIENGHSSPLLDPWVQETMDGLSREHRRAPGQVTGLMLVQLEIIAASIYDRKVHKDYTEDYMDVQRRASTDIAIITLMRDGMLRRSEAAAARWCDLEYESDGTGRLTIPISKTDQKGKSTVVFVWKSTHQHLDTMLDYRRSKPTKSTDSIFPISGRQIANRIQAACEFAGLEGRYRGHSPRVGMAMDLAMGNVELPSIMQSGRWGSPDMPARYTRAIAAGRGAVAQWNQELDHEPIKIETL